MTKSHAKPHNRPLLQALLLSLCLCLCLAGCGGGDGEAPREVDIAALAADLAENLPFEDQMELIDADMVSFYYDVPEGGQAVFYLGSGATAEEVAVFQLTDTARAEEMLAVAKAHIADQRESYESYIPEETARLDKALVMQRDRYVIVCVIADPAPAEEIINGYWK